MTCFFKTKTYLNFENSDDMRIVIIYIVGIMFFGIGSLIGEIMHPYAPLKNKITFIKKKLNKHQRLIIIFLILVSIFLFIFFCYETRLSTISLMFENLFFGSSDDITDSRLESYSVPGTAIIYAFRISLLPAITIALVNKEYGLSKTIKTILIVFMVFFTLITGQRAGFFMVMLTWLITFMIPIFIKKNGFQKKGLVKKGIIIMILFLFIFYFLSMINGRISENFFAEIIQRFFDDNQGSAYYAFQYFFKSDISWGRNYLEEIVNLVTPGDKYLPISRVIFEIMYGSTRGTAPPCLWGSLYYNFSWIGIILFGFLYGVFAQYVGYRFYSREVDGLRCAIYGYMFINLGLLVSGGPLHLFNNGFVPLVILGWLLHIDKNSKKVLQNNY